jgi:FAD/FMN-containing dehydrogenase
VANLVAEAGAAARHIEVIGAGTKRAIGSMDRIDQVISTQRLDRIVDYAPRS